MINYNFCSLDCFCSWLSGQRILSDTLRKEQGEKQKGWSQRYRRNSRS